MEMRTMCKQPSGDVTRCMIPTLTTPFLVLVLAWLCHGPLASVFPSDDTNSIRLVPQSFQVRSGTLNGSDWYQRSSQVDPTGIEFEPGRQPIYENDESVRMVAVKPRKLEPAFHTLIMPDTRSPWMQVRFSDYDLGNDSYIILTSLDDGDWQYLDQTYLPIYSDTSGIFSGGGVELALYLAPGDDGVFVNVGEILVGDPSVFDADPTATEGGVASICGDFDDRVTSNDPRCGRLFFGGCTGWLVHNGAALTAGHCGNPDGNLSGVTLEFNVPASSSTGVPNQAVLNNQYPVTGVFAFESDGEGEDYSVFSVGLNSNTQLRAHLVQGFYHMTGLVPSEGTTLRVTGYGLDNRPAGPSFTCCSRDADGTCTHTNCNSSSLTQQTDTGSCNDCLVGTAIEHTVDTEPANSGSPILWESRNLAIAIHTEGGCDNFFSDYDNAGTWLGYGPLSSTLHGVLGPGTVWANSVAAFPVAELGLAIYPTRTVTTAVNFVPNGGQLAIVAGFYPASAGNTFTAGADGKFMTFLAPVGPATIGN